MRFFIIIAAASVLAAILFAVIQQYSFSRTAQKKRSANEMLPYSKMEYLNHEAHPTIEPVLPAQQLAVFERPQLDRLPLFNKSNFSATHRGAVLIVDDGYTFRKLIGEMLKDAGYVGIEAETGEAAIAACHQDVISCVLLDLKLPDMSGIDVLEAIRSIHHELPVVLMTGFIDAQMLTAGHKLGYDYLLEKPFDPLELLVIIEELTSGSSKVEIS